MDIPVLLIVDDEEHILNSLKRSLRDLFTLFTASSGAAALEILSSQKVDLILTDERMPGMTGVELLAQAYQVQPEALGTIISAYTDVEALTSALNLKNVRGFMPKPWNIEELRSRLMEMLLDQNEHFINQVLDNTADGITIFDRIEKRIVFANRGAEECLGYPVAEIKHMPGGYLQHLAHPDEILALTRHLEMLAGAPDNQVIELQTRYQHGNGQWRYLAIWDRVLRRDANGNPRLILGTIRDITQTRLDQAALRQANELLETRVAERTAQLVEEVNVRRQTEEALRASETRFRTAVILAPFPIMLHAEDGNVELVNDEWCHISGYSHQDIPTTSAWTEKAYGRRKELVQADIEKLYGITEKVDEGEYVIRTKAGENRYWYFSSTPLGKTPDGRRLAMSMALDFTTRKLVEEALRESEGRYQAIVDNLPNGIVHIFDRNFRYLFAAGEGFHQLGWPYKEWVGKTIFEVHSPEEAAKTVDRYRPVLTGESIKFSEEYGDQSFLVHAVPLRNDIGEINQILALSINVTELKRQDVKLNEQLDELRRWHAVMLGREGRVLDLKYEVNRLLEQMGQPPRYPSAEPEVH